MKHYEVTAAIIINENQVLCMQRGPSKYDYVSYKYEFPGGKVEPGESNEEALSRELKEEMSLNVKVDQDNYFMTVEHQYPDFSIEMHSFIVPVDHREFEMNEHRNCVWLDYQKLKTLDWAEADIPIMEKLMKIEA